MRVPEDVYKRQREAEERKISVLKLEGLATAPEVTRRIDNESAQMLGAPHQFKEDGRRAGVHLELIAHLGTPRLRN